MGLFPYESYWTVVNNTPYELVLVKADVNRTSGFTGDPKWAVAPPQSIPAGQTIHFQIHASDNYDIDAWIAYAVHGAPAAGNVTFVPHVYPLDIFDRQNEIRANAQVDNSLAATLYVTGTAYASDPRWQGTWSVKAYVAP